MCSDPLVRKQFRLFKSLETKELGLTFLQRMEHDKSARDIVTHAIGSNFGFQDIINIARQSTRFFIDETEL